MKLSSEMLPKFAIFWNKKKQIIFSLWATLDVENLKLLKMKKTIWVFLFQKYGKFWIILLCHFIKHKPLISEEWSTIKNHTPCVYCKFIFRYSYKIIAQPLVAAHSKVRPVFIYVSAETMNFRQWRKWLFYKLGNFQSGKKN